MCSNGSPSWSTVTMPGCTSASVAVTFPAPAASASESNRSPVGCSVVGASTSVAVSAVRPSDPSSSQ